MGSIDVQTILAVLLAVAAVIMFTRTGWQGKSAAWQEIADKHEGKLTVAGFIPPPTMKLETVIDGVAIRAVFAFPPDPRLTVVSAPYVDGEGARYSLRTRSDEKKDAGVSVDEELDEKFVAEGDAALLRELWSPERRAMLLSLVGSDVNTAEIEADGKSVKLERVGLLDTKETLGAAVDLVVGLAKSTR